jgi:hypothetical protein
VLSHGQVANTLALRSTAASVLFELLQRPCRTGFAGNERGNQMLKNLEPGKGGWIHGDILPRFADSRRSGGELAA